MLKKSIQKLTVMNPVSWKKFKDWVQLLNNQPDIIFVGLDQMIKTFKVTVEGEKTSFYIEPKYYSKIITVLDNFDCLSQVNAMMLLPKPEVIKEVILSHEQGGCIKCGKYRGKRRQNKKLCLLCQRERKAKRIDASDVKL